MPDTLKRRLGLGLLTVYGVGIMVGAGIYVLVGAAAGQAGIWAPVSFLLAAVVVAPTALTYCELSSRIPEAAGESAYVDAGIGWHWLALLVGAIMVIAGTVAAAAVLRGGVGYLTSVTPMRFDVAVIGLGLLLMLIAMIGALESLSFAAILTLIEVSGLLIIIWAGFSAVPVADWQSPPPPQWSGIIGASVFAFFAFIGFEDLVNMSEETRNPTRNMPRAILMALGITAVLYALVSLAAVRAVPVDRLSQSSRPLALVWEVATGRPAAFMAWIAVAAALNGVLAQIVMASRVLFGLGKRTAFLAVFHRAHPRFGTPVLATVLIGATVIISALALPVAKLAELTSMALLLVFAIVNTTLIALKYRQPVAPFRVPAIVPWFGMLASLAAFGATIGVSQ
jgi:amino acid transporter